jgi:hypothetical protein
VTARKPSADQVREAKEKGMALVRRLEKLDELSVDEVIALAEALEALLLEYPAVYKEPPVPLEMLREHIEELRQAEDAVRQAEEEGKVASQKLAEAHAHLEAAVERELGPSRKKGEKPS